MSVHGIACVQHLHSHFCQKTMQRGGALCDSDVLVVFVAVVAVECDAIQDPSILCDK